MGNWLDGDLFKEFQNEKIEEKDSNSLMRRSELLWKNPERGTTERPKVYEGRFLQDPKGKFYKRYYYHMWQSGENWIFVLCPKTHDWKEYCPFCSVVSKLYNGTQSDKKQAYFMKRKERFVGNFFIVKDNRDEDADEDRKVTGKVKIYEFPGAVEIKLKKEITDKSQGYGKQIFDPSEDGRNFIIEVLSTKKDKDGKQYPDYSNSSFSRNQVALGTDDEIKEIMETRIDIEEYIKSKEISMEKQIEILKNEFLWDTVMDECLSKGYEDVETKIDISKDDKELPWDKDEETDESTINESTKEENSDDSDESTDVDDVDDMDDSDLLAELDDL